MSEPAAGLAPMRAGVELEAPSFEVGAFVDERFPGGGFPGALADSRLAVPGWRVGGAGGTGTVFGHGLLSGPAPAPPQPGLGDEPELLDLCSTLDKGSLSFSSVTPCQWTVQGYAVSVVDPNTDGCWGTTGPVELDWVVDTTSTCTIVLPDGTVRMYMQNARLVPTVDNGLDAYADWPQAIQDASSAFANFKFKFADDWLGGTGALWSAFDGRFISYVDSTDGGRTFSVQVPDVVVYDSPLGCNYEQNEPAIDQANAGWGLTGIPCTQQGTVYRDVSVVRVSSRLESYYLMFAVECSSPSGSGVPPGIQDGELADGGFAEPGACSICVPSNANSSECRFHNDEENAVTPTTRLVVFVSSSPDFASYRGPFDALTRQPMPGDGEWMGVPHAFQDPDGDFVFIRYAIAGGADEVRAALSSKLAAEVASVMGASTPDLARHFKSVGTPTVDGNVANPEEAGNDPDATGRVDEQFAFCPDGRLQVFWREDHGFPTCQSYIRQATAEDPFDAASLRSWLGGSTSLVLNQLVPKMLTRFVSMPCIAIEPDAQLGILGQVADPDVVFLPDGTVLMHFAVLGTGHKSLVSATADTESLCCRADCVAEHGGGVPGPGSNLLGYTRCVLDCEGLPGLASVTSVGPKSGTRQ